MTICHECKENRFGAIELLLGFCPNCEKLFVAQISTSELEVKNNPEYTPQINTPHGGKEDRTE